MIMTQAKTASCWRASDWTRKTRDPRDLNLTRQDGERRTVGVRLFIPEMTTGGYASEFRVRPCANRTARSLEGVPIAKPRAERSGAILRYSNVNLQLSLAARYIGHPTVT